MPGLKPLGRHLSRLLAAGLLLLGAGVAATAEAHEDAAPERFPVQVGGPFSLIDHQGRRVTDQDFRGQYMLVYFGYAKCPGICPVALRHMTDALDLLGAAGARIQPVLITVDPENDTPEALAEAIPRIHPRLIGLTGTSEELAAVMRAYKVEAAPVGRSWTGTQVFRHGTFIYLMDPGGGLLTVLPPVVGAQRMAEILRRYLA